MDAVITAFKRPRVYAGGMNAIGPIEAALPREPFEAVRDYLYSWRGRCVDAFAGSEAAVTETLLVLAGVEGRGASVKLPHLVGQKYDALATALEGPYAEQGRAAATALARFRPHHDLRTVVTHGVFDVLLDKSGEWYLRAHVLALRSQRESREISMWTRSEAEDRLTSLRSDANRLRTKLQQLRKRVRSPA